MLGKIFNFIGLKKREVSKPELDYFNLKVSRSQYYELLENFRQINDKKLKEIEKDHLEIERLKSEIRNRPERRYLKKVADQ